MAESIPSPARLDHARHRVALWLDRPGFRLALQLAGSAWITAARQPCRVTWKGGWIHRYRDGVIVGPTIGGPTPSQAEASARDVFLHDHRIRPGDAVVDLGAGVGGEVGLFSRLAGPGGRVVAVEAHPVTFRHLEMHCALNGLDNVHPVQAAVSDRDGTLHMTSGANHLRNSVVAGGQGVEVRAITLDHLFEEAGLDRIDFLKINIEGAELPVLRASGNALDRTRNLCVSCHDFLADGAGDEGLRTHREVSALLEDRGFVLRFRRDDPRPWVRDQVWARRP